MATATAARNYHGQLTAGGVDTITCPTTALLTIITDGSAAIYYTIDGTTPSSSGASNTRILPATICSDEPPIGDFSRSVVVTLTSAGTPHYSIICDD